MIIVTSLLIVVLALALLAPMDSMRWWDRRESGGRVVPVPPANPDHLPRRPDARAFVVYLSGIGAVDGTTDDDWERATLASLSDDLPDVAFAADVFPYAVEGSTRAHPAGVRLVLGTPRRLAAAQPQPAAGGGVLPDQPAQRHAGDGLGQSRYGPTFNLAVAEQIIDSLDRHDYDWNRRPPVIIVGYSGGGQIAVGAGWYLTAAKIPLSVISLAGVVDSNPGLRRIDHLWHLYGGKDSLQRIGPAVFPGRWLFMTRSLWNQGKRDGRITVECLGPMTHVGKGGYFDADTTGADGRSFRDVTADAVRAILEADVAGAAG